METATQLIVEWEDCETHCLTGQLKKPLDLHEVSDHLLHKTGKRPSRLEIIDRVAIAEY